MTEIRIYYEGDRKLRPGFHQFFTELIARARQVNCRFQLIPCDGNARKLHRAGCRNHSSSWNILLVDQERLTPDPPDDEFWMVELMEAWFLADPDALSRYYGEEFNASALPSNRNVEQIPKQDVMRGLRDATRRTQKKLAYHKTAHAPDLLAAIDPEKVQTAAPNCQRLFHAVLRAIAAS